MNPSLARINLGGRSVSVSRSLLFKECLDMCNMMDIGLQDPVSLGQIEGRFKP